MPKYIDIHCHLQNVPEPEIVLNSAEKSGVVCCVCNSTSEKDWTKLLDLSKNYSAVKCAFGIHPWNVKDLREGWEQRLTEVLNQNSEFMVGEIGLDKYKPDMDLQEKVFCAQLDVATNLNRTVHIHCVGVWDKMLHILKERGKEIPPKLIFHSYNGGADVMGRLLSLGNVYFSYSPLVFTDGHNKLKESAVATPHDRILIESDNEKIENVIKVAERLAEMRDAEKSDFIKQVYENSKRVLNNG